MLEIQNLRAHSFAIKLLKWYAVHKRDLPWRHNSDAYNVWLSEIILQQTQVNQGWAYYSRILLAYPTVDDLANAKDDDFYALWAGLGYYSRARNILKAARYILDECNSIFPSTKSALIDLPGVGDYTASAIASICFNEPHMAMDGNLGRIFSRVFCFEGDIKKERDKKELKSMAMPFFSMEYPGDFNQALMDLGSAICKPKNPICNECPVTEHCLAFDKKVQTNFPIKAKPIKKETLHLHYFVPSTGNIFLKRRGKGIWNNLYEPPGFWQTDNGEIVYSNCEHLEKRISEDAVKWTTKHLLSHKTMFITLYEIGDLEAVEFIKTTESEVHKYGVPRPFEIYFNKVKTVLKE